MRDRIIRLLEFTQEKMPNFTSFDIKSLLPFWIEPINLNVQAYFTSSVPESSVSPGHFELLSPQDIVSESTRYVPGIDLYGRGFIPIATTGSGDAVTVDITSGAVKVFCHELSYPANLSRDAIADLAEEEFPSLDAFFAEWEERLRSPD